MKIKKEYQNITFNDNHYIINGKPYPRVSKFLENLDKRALIQWAANQTAEYINTKLADKYSLQSYTYEFDTDYLTELLTLAKTEHIRQREYAAAKGKLIHSAIEHWLKDKDYTPTAKSKQDFDKINLALENFKKWWIENEFKLIASEMSVGSIEYGFGGTIDILAKQKDEVILIDIKSSKGVWNSHKIQCGGYTIALEEMTSIFKPKLIKEIKNNTMTHIHTVIDNSTKISKAIICHIPSINPKVKAIEVKGDEFEACKDAFINLVDLHYNLEGIK